MEAIETFELAGRTVKIHYEEYPEDPRQFDPMGRMVFAASREYVLGDDQYETARWCKDDVAPETIARWLTRFGGAAVVVGLQFNDYGSSGAVLLVDDDPEGANGFLYVTKDKVLEEYGDLSPESLDKARHHLHAEANEYKAWVEGRVYGFTVSDDAGNVLDSCWGFYGDDWEASGLLDAARESADEYRAPEGRELAALLLPMIS